MSCLKNKKKITEKFFTPDQMVSPVSSIQMLILMKRKMTRKTTLQKRKIKQDVTHRLIIIVDFLELSKATNIC
jgi:hypothetical protein